MAKKISSGQINFFKSMAVLGVLVMGVILYSFWNSAPRLNNRDYHKSTVSVDDCLQCHMRNVGKNPIMPHRSMENCVFCHRPEIPPDRQGG
jgi:hypothetical protein